MNRRTGSQSTALHQDKRGRHCGAGRCHIAPDSSLALANVVAAVINDRPLRTVDHQVLSNNRTGSLPSDPLGQSPGMKLLEGSRRIAGRMQAEVADFVQALSNNAFAEVATCWKPEDLLNIAIVQTGASADLSSSPSYSTETFYRRSLPPEHWASSMKP